MNNSNHFRTLAALLFSAGILLGIATSALADVHYVDLNSTNATPPYTNWATAATIIQAAVDASMAGDEVVVTNGTYVTGGRAAANDTTINRVVVDGPVHVRSINGPRVTTIDGGAAVRCAYMTNGASFSGFTLTNGHVESTSGFVPASGGGALGGTLSYCTLINNVAGGNFDEPSASIGGNGGGAAYCTLNNCSLVGNSANFFSARPGGEWGNGGGAYRCTLNNCTLSGNSANNYFDYLILANDSGRYGDGGGGAYCILNNCTLTGNSADDVSPSAGFPGAYGDYGDGGGAYFCTLNNCTLTGNSSSDGSGASDCALNNCITYLNEGQNYDSSCTLSSCCTTPLPTTGVANITNAPLFVDTNGWANLRLQFNSPCINAGNNSYLTNSYFTNSFDLDGNPRIDRGTVDIGAYEFQSTTRYVDLNSTHATPPYTNWATAASNIQDAVDAAVAGDDIVVTNGGYGAVAVDKALGIRSVNGPQSTIIYGDAWDEIRCVYLTNGASISGFTLTGGGGYNVIGGGAIGGTLSNCVVSGNFAWSAGGGAAFCTLNNCTLTGNSAGEMIDTYSSPSVSYGGGAYHCALNNCTLTDNEAEGYDDPYGGGAAFCTLSNCALSGNSVKVNRDSTSIGCVSFSSYVEGGGGVYGCALNNCTLSGNSAVGYFDSGWADCFGQRLHITISIAAYGGGASECTLNDCIVYLNTAANWPEYYACSLSYCWTADPLFVSGTLRPQSNSPCINAGSNAYAPAGADLDGNPRIVGGTVDIGAYEYQSPVSQISYAWLQQYGLPINSSTDAADPDGDAVDNYHEWLAGTNPTNSISSPAQLTITPSGTNVVLSWSTNAVGFTLQSATNLVSLAIWSTNSPAPIVVNGQNAITNPISGTQQFYRLSRQRGGGTWPGGCVTDTECPVGYQCIAGRCVDRQ